MHWGTDTAQILCSSEMRRHRRFALYRWTSTICRRPITPQGHWDVDKAEEMNANKNVKIVVLHVHISSIQYGTIKCVKKIRKIFASTYKCNALIRWTWFFFSLRFGDSLAFVESKKSKKIVIWSREMTFDLILHNSETKIQCFISKEQIVDNVWWFYDLFI